MITIHTIVCNEDRFIKAAFTSVLASSDVTRALVWDAGSIDKTVEEIQSINDPRIEFRQLGKVNRKQLVEYRNEQLKRTKTPWFMLLDGDEIWTRKNLRFLISTMKQCSNETIALVCRTRNVIGDLYHYLPESEGHYRIGSWTGHLNIRAIRNAKGLVIKGEYPNEWYELDGKKIQEYPSCVKVRPSDTQRSDLNKAKRCLRFVDTWYLHATHLKRSGSRFSEVITIDRWKKHMVLWRLKGIKLLPLKTNELPVDLSDE